ncbi:MAG TPA: DCC1-like thiol-disulfide oxidoreductase family protein [Xanthobacteraceae bacterium]|nr:DCC1-like thiol-disulfide oxidoreductase family protein [Xanthobacteraceae bacterium]
MDLIVYDGVCMLCARSIRFIARHDRSVNFRFVPLQSPYGRQLAERAGVSISNPETFVAILDGVAAFRSEAALGVLSRLPGFAWTSVLRAVPRPLRDGIYDLIARHRYRWFGRSEQCRLPGPGLAARVIEEIPAAATFDHGTFRSN